MSVFSAGRASAVLAAALTATGCAYQTYMAEERSRTTTLNAELKSEKAKTPGLEHRSRDLEQRKARLSRDLASLRGKLNADRAELARLSGASPGSRSRTSSSDVTRLKREIATTEQRIRNKEDELATLTTY